MNAKSFNLTAQGSSHIRKNKECQDSSLCYQDENCIIAIVCDGHGGDDYVRSAIGSKIGCDVAKDNIKNFILGLDKETFLINPRKHLKNLEASIINGWNESIARYHSENPFENSELSVVSEKARKKYLEEERIESAYGTTMIAVAMGNEYWFGIHIGDGKCVAINSEGEFKQPIPWDPKCFLNATTSICDSDAIERFREFYSEKMPAAVFVGSDGIDDCFSNNEQLYNLYKTVLYSFAVTDFKEACEGLEDYLPRLSAKGSGDDVSVAAILDLDLIPKLSVVKEFDMEKERARVEENARKEAEKNEAEKRRVEEEHARFQQQKASDIRKTKSNSPKFCENCGERIRIGFNFCSNCGSKINYNAIPEQYYDEQNSISSLNESNENAHECIELPKENNGVLAVDDINNDNGIEYDDNKASTPADDSSDEFETKVSEFDDCVELQEPEFIDTGSTAAKNEETLDLNNSIATEKTENEKVVFTGNLSNDDKQSELDVGKELEFKK